jgi:hypothetical protein
VRGGGGGERDERGDQERDAHCGSRSEIVVMEDIEEKRFDRFASVSLGGCRLA